MISKGDLVQDWMGRAGIALGHCDPPENGDCEPYMQRVRLQHEQALRWWSIYLFSGAVAKSPEPAMDSWGPATKAVLLWAINRAERSVQLLLANLLDPEEQSECYN
jgi:hypothetical protein